MSRAAFRCALLTAVLLPVSGCTWISHLGTDERGSEFGRTYFVGGAGSLGNMIGTLDVPAGLRQGGYRGSVEVFAWQAVLGGTLRDQIDRNRNEGQGRELAAKIREYMRRRPGRHVNIIALSAGTGVATWALEALPRECQVSTVVFLSSSMSRNYDLSYALQRVSGRLYCFCSPDDPLLRFGLPLTGSVDREDTNAGAAGLDGFIIPPHASPAARRLYEQKLRNRPYRAEYAAYGYHGLHTDSTAPKFIARVVRPLLNGAPEQATSQTARAEPTGRLAATRERE